MVDEKRFVLRVVALVLYSDLVFMQGRRQSRPRRAGQCQHRQPVKAAVHFIASIFLSRAKHIRRTRANYFRSLSASLRSVQKRLSFRVANSCSTPLMDEEFGFLAHARKSQRSACLSCQSILLASVFCLPVVLSPMSPSGFSLLLLSHSSSPFQSLSLSIIVLKML